MVSKLDEYFSLNQAALNLRAQRQQIIASNIANADTPNYKARDIDFSNALQAALQGADPAPGGTGTTAVQAAVQYRGVVQGTVDGNTVEMDAERSQFADNALRYEATLTLINSDVKTMLAVIQGGG